jgi:hypothetical protein
VSSDHRLKIYSAAKYIPDGLPCFVMLAPFFGAPPEDPREPEAGRFDAYYERATELFELTTLARAEVAVLPVAWEHVRGDPRAEVLANELAQRAAEAGKPLVLFFISDSAEKVPLKSVCVFRTSMYRSRRDPNEFAVPAWSEDIVERHLGGHLSLRSKQERPTVGFCGFAGYSMPTSDRMTVRAKTFARRMKHRVRKPTIRESVIARLRSSTTIDLNLVLREQFWAGVGDPSVPHEERAKARSEYVNNMIGSDYVVCARGGGNFSYRLYETLCAGRIPLFIDTDCVLPYDFELAWKDYCVCIDESELIDVEQRVMQFHESLSSEAFLDLQRRCRRLWEDRISPLGFFSNFYRHFSTH